MALVIKQPVGASRFVWAHSLDWAAASLSGVIAGAVFMMLEMIMVPLFLGMSAWGPPRMIAAIVMGRGTLPSPDVPPPFDLGILMVALLVHMVLSIVYASIGGLLFHRMRMSPAILWGAVLGVALYLLNFYVFTLVFDWFAMARNWVSVFAHIMFGIVAAWSYKGLQHEVEPTATTAL